METQIKATKAKCKRCGYEWTTLSSAFYVSCPSCLTKVMIRSMRKLEQTK